MKTANNSRPASGQSAGVSHGQAVTREQGSEWSALMDGELNADDLPALLQRLAQDASSRQRCQSYQLIGDALRGSLTATVAVPPHDFLAGVRARLAAEPVTTPVVSPAAAGVELHAQLRPPAANDAVFRWKLVAGVASLAAVLAVSWGVIGTAPTGAGGLAGPQLAMTLPQSAPAALTQQTGAVVVNTNQGPVLRDARLEELLAEHRQYGGMSALQMPAGFLRDATYQSAPQR